MHFWPRYIFHLLNGLLEKNNICQMLVQPCLSLPVHQFSRSRDTNSNNGFWSRSKSFLTVVLQRNNNATLQTKQSVEFTKKYFGQNENFMDFISCPFFAAKPQYCDNAIASNESNWQKIFGPKYYFIDFLIVMNCPIIFSIFQNEEIFLW